MDKAAAQLNPVPPAPRATAGQASSALERDADRRAADALAGHGPAFAQRLAPRGASQPVHAGVPRSAGEPLAATLRSRLEPRFGVDFGAVRIHRGPAAQRAARDRRAHAFAVGVHIVLGDRAERTSDGPALLAHELAHVAQFAQGAPARPRLKEDPTAPAAKWYQEAIDQVTLSKDRMARDARSGGFVMAPPYYDLEKAILELCEAVDVRDSALARKKLDALLAHKSLWVHLQILSRALLTELSARLYEMGLETESDLLRRTYAEQSKDGPYNDDWYGTERRLKFLERLVAGASAEARAESAASIATGMHRFARAFAPLRLAYLAIDFKAVEWARQSNASRYTLRPHRSADEVYREIHTLLAAWHAGWSGFVQRALDATRADLESAQPTGSGATMLAALRGALTGELQGELFPKDPAQDISGAESFDITKTEMTGPGAGRIDDAFAGAKTARSVPVTTYDPEQAWARELRTTLAASWRVRVAQVHALGRLHGVLDALTPDKDFAKTMDNAQEASANAKSVERSGRLRLDNDDDWRAFLLQKYRDLTQGADGAAKMDPADALKEVVALLFGTLQAFTVHARFTNLYDVGQTPYFNRPFPRTLTGELVHDCGVYAMRVAYMLSLVRKELGLKFWFVRLPAHVTLVVNGESGSTLPTFVMANDHCKVWNPGWLDEQREKWQRFNDPATGQPPPGKADDTQFIAELAAADDISGPIDMPARVSAVPPPTADLKAEQRQLWAHYQSRPLADDVFGPATDAKTGDNRLFHKHYLELGEKLRAIYNEVVLQFWNIDAPAAWNALVASLAGSDAKAPRSEVKVAELLSLLAVYKLAYFKAVEPVHQRMKAYEAEQERISRKLREDKALSRPDSRITAGLRASLLVKQGWQWHEEALVEYEVVQLGRAPGETETIDALRGKLLPGWIPTEENRLDRFD